MKTETQEIKFSKEAAELILNGGQVVWKKGHRKYGFIVVLIRMPKGKWVSAYNTFSKEHLEYEYAWLTNDSFYGIDELDVCGWKNGHLREVKKRVNEEFMEILGYNLRK